MSEMKAKQNAPGARPAGKEDDLPDVGPTGPASVEGEKTGPQTGGYDRQSPDRSSDNAKGGYGAG